MKRRSSASRVALMLSSLFLNLTLSLYSSFTSFSVFAFRFPLLVFPNSSAYPSDLRLLCLLFLPLSLSLPLLLLLLLLLSLSLSFPFFDLRFRFAFFFASSSLSDASESTSRPTMTRCSSYPSCFCGPSLVPVAPCPSGSGLRC